MVVLKKCAEVTSPVVFRAFAPMRGTTWRIQLWACKRSTRAQVRTFKIKATHTFRMDLLTVTQTWGGHCQTPSISNDCDLGNLSSLTTPAQTGSKGNATLWYTLGICGRCYDHRGSLYGKHRQRPDGPGRSSRSNVKGVLTCSEMQRFWGKKNKKSSLLTLLLSAAKQLHFSKNLQEDGRREDHLAAWMFRKSAPQTRLLRPKSKLSQLDKDIGWLAHLLFAAENVSSAPWNFPGEGKGW